MNQAKLAEARRLYHHVCNGGTLTPEDVSFMVVALEEAYEQVEVDRLRAKKKQIYEDLQDSVEREWVGLIDEDIDEIKQTAPVYVSAKAVSAIVPMVEAKLKEKNT